jgi:aryl-alcohol dehydrogenase-like predicted oxidoreductase
MRYQLLGRSGLRVSEICLGTMTFGEEWGWGSSKEESRGIYDRFRDLGGNFIDTANLYTNGTSELFLGEVMQGHRDCRIAWLVSFRRVTDRVQLTREDARTGTFADGCRPWPFRDRMEPPGGLLSGKYRVTEQGIQSRDGTSRMDNPDMQQFAQNRERTNRVIDELQAVAQETGHSPAQVALAWLRHRKSSVIPIIGARRIDQLEANLGIVDVKLSAEQIRALDEASQIELGFPHDFLEKPMVKAFTFGGTRDLIDA